VIAIGGKAGLRRAAVIGSIYEYSLASCAFTRCTALTPTPGVPGSRRLCVTEEFVRHVEEDWG